MKFVILFLGVLILNTFMISGMAEDSFVNEIVEKINDNGLYLKFISESKYNTVKLIVEEEVYYFKHNENLIEIVKEIEKPDVVIKMSSKRFDEFFEAYEDNDVKKLKRMVFKSLPFRVKFNVFFQCLKTDWCRGMIL